MIELRFRLKLRSKTLITISTGISYTSGADIPFFRSPNGKYIIPGSTVKGVLRRCASRVAPLLGLTSCGEIEPAKIWGKHADMVKSGTQLPELDGRHVCHVCHLMGAPGIIRSRLHVPQFICKFEDSPLIHTRIRIDDRSLTVSEGGLFVLEAFPPGTEFEPSHDVIIYAKDEDEAVWSQNLFLAAVANLRYEVIGRGAMVDVKIEKYNKSFANKHEISRTLIQILSDWGDQIENL
ncbi:MAG: RAMP superfamily CRISPR-associated protein [Candidatus Baldrarchaeia archaeon]